MLTETTDTQHAPGCFGSALMCRPDTAECASCVFVERCGLQSEARRAALHARFGVTPKVAPARKAKAKAPAGEVLVSVKVRELIGRIERAGIAVTDNLAAGVNPFNKPAFLKIACHLLLRLPGGFTRDTLVAAFMSKLGWGRETALAYSGQAFEFLTALGAADITNGRLILRENQS